MRRFGDKCDRNRGRNRVNFRGQIGRFWGKWEGNRGKKKRGKMRRFGDKCDRNRGKNRVNFRGQMGRFWGKWEGNRGKKSEVKWDDSEGNVEEIEATCNIISVGEEQRKLGEESHHPTNVLTLNEHIVCMRAIARTLTIVHKLQKKGQQSICSP